MLDPLLEETAGHVSPRQLRRIHRKQEPRIPTRFERWAWSPILAYRMGLSLSYIAMVYFGVSAFISGVPVFRLTAPEGWTPIWSIVLVLGGIVASFGSTGDTKALRNIELVGAWALFLTLGGYALTILFLAYATGDVNRAAVGAGFIALGVSPGVRLLWLMTQLGRKKDQAHE